MAAQAEVERLYARWAELDEKRAQTVQVRDEENWLGTRNRT